MRRKILSLLLALVMVLGLLPAQAVAAAEETSWDGTTQTEPQTDSDGVYQISNGAELAWFVAKSETLKSKVSISGKLTADINLGNQAWVASTTSGNGQIINLDGDGHKVTGLNSTLGLFGVVSNVSSVVKSLSVYGTVVGSEGQHKVGGIAAYFNGTMENCVNYASVTGSVNTNYNNASWVGGLVGYTANKANKFINCANYGVIQADGNYVGGLIGCMYSGCTVTCCYNTGNVTGAQYVGGLVGGMNTDPATVTGCYNTGNVSGTQYVGGLFGFAKASNGKNPTQVNDCYSAGTVAGTGDTHPLFGKAYVADKPFVTTSGCVYLDTTGTDSYGTAKTETQLKALDGLSSTYFKASCGGYPAVSWQTAVNHSPNGAGEVTDPTCTTGGYTTYTCSVCGASYQDLFTAALGHEYCEHSVDTTCEHCEQDPAPGETTYGTLKRHCQNGCGTDREESIKPTIRYTITLPANTIGYTVAPADGSTSPVATDESFSFTVTIVDGYKKGEDFAVKANDTPLTENNGVYTIEKINAHQTVTVEGVEEKTLADYNVTVIAPAGSTVTAGQFYNYYQYDFVNALDNEMLKAYFLSGLSATLNGSAMTAGQPTAVRLVNGKATVSIEAKIDLEGEVYKRVKTIVISVAEPDFYDVTLPSGKGYTVTGEDTVAAGGDYTFTVEVQEGYDGSSMVVKVNDEPVTAGEDGSYKVENVHEALTITVEGVEKQPVPITPVGPGAPGTPSTPSEPGEPGTPEEPEQPAEPETPAVSFTDVSGHWASDAIAYVVANDLMNGTGDGKFSPDATTTRGMIVTILARLEGVDTTTGSIWYEVGRQWAMANGISDGSNMTGEMTREQLATMLYRYAQSKGYDTTARADLSSFADATSVSNWAQDAMQWAVSVGLIQGSNNQLAPTAPATRAQVATILMRFIENLAK